MDTSTEMIGITMISSMSMADGCYDLPASAQGRHKGRAGQIRRKLGSWHGPPPWLRGQDRPLSQSRLRRGAVSGLRSTSALRRAPGRRGDVRSTNQAKEIERRGEWTSARRMLSPLLLPGSLVTQRDDGIDSRGAASRMIACGKSGDCEN